MIHRNHKFLIEECDNPYDKLNYLLQEIRMTPVNENVSLSGRIDIAIPTKNNLVPILSYSGIWGIERKGPTDYRIYVGNRDPPLVFHHTGLKIPSIITSGPWQVTREDPPYFNDPETDTLKESKGPYIHKGGFCGKLPIEVIIYPPRCVNGHGWGFGGPL